MHLLLLRIRRFLFGGRIVVIHDQSVGSVRFCLAKTYGRREVVRFKKYYIELYDDLTTSWNLRSLYWEDM